ncbi:membrane-spanning 4-domains subfamily A member 10 [Choloepus didactylus]|uniref:membrane-spanning 4-domains subfamily A member 10 n=1 Tax=Choloepus didactylus TaxID=27675 RepID=UPI00189DDD9B|nr:membrane-spanning 4-domains subfamily A member 10 [Choloepus didactylus]
MAAEANGASADIPGSRAGGVLPSLPLDPTQLGQTSSLQKGTDPGFLPPDWHQKGPQKRSGLLKQLGAFHVVVALLHLILGAYLLSAVKDLHLVALRSWYPFWGAASFLISGILAIALETFSKSYLRALCLTMNLISFFCVLCGFYVIIKDLFLESPFESPIWRTYPSPMVHIQRLELALLCFTSLELFLPWSTAIMAWKSKHLPVEEDDLSLIPDPPFVLSGLSTPPPSYEKAIQDDEKDEPKQR